jgi:hypothetical protein
MDSTTSRDGPRVTGPAFYFPSIEKKYGKPIDHWLDLIGSSELTSHKALVDWLKAGAGQQADPKPEGISPA